MYTLVMSIDVNIYNEDVKEADVMETMSRAGDGNNTLQESSVTFHQKWPQNTLNILQYAWCSYSV